MSQFRPLFLVALLALLSPPLHPETTKQEEYAIDRKTSRLFFFAKSSLMDVNGRFMKYRLRSFHEGNPYPTLSLEIFAHSISTGDIFNDSMLRSEKFFHVEKYPLMRIQLLGRDPRNPDQAKVRIEIKEHKEEISFPMETEQRGKQWHLSGGFWVNRKDFGMNYESALNPIKDQVRIQFQIVIKPSS